MKKIIYFLLPVALLLTNCNKKQEQQLQQRNQELNEIIGERDSIINELNNTLNEIETNLGIKPASEAERANLRNRIQRDIDHINDLMARNQNKYDSLQRLIRVNRGRSSKPI
ncbi:MAG: hypothetical protein HC906_11170 [Bacteroidales bacterium]|nr:hypothetical protein [Bacteroidales bacterium]